MRGMRAGRIICVLIVLTLMLTMGSACASGDTLRVGVRDDIMNFGYLNKTTGKYYGLEIDLAYKLAEELGYKSVAFTTVTPDNRKEKLINGEVDCLIACYSIAETRLKNFDFSTPYYVDGIRVMVQKSTLFTSLKDLRNKKVGVLAGANTAILLGIKMHEEGFLPAFDEATFNPITFSDGLSYLRAERYADLVTVLENGEVDAVCMDGCIAQGYMTGERVFLDTVIATQEYGVATQKNSELSQPMARAVQKFLDDGTMDALIDKWD